MSTTAANCGTRTCRRARRPRPPVTKRPANNSSPLPWAEGAPGNPATPSSRSADDADHFTDGARSKDLLVRPEDVQVLHGFGTVSQANAYLKSALFTDDVVGGLKPLLEAGPDIKIYEAA